MKCLLFAGLLLPLLCIADERLVIQTLSHHVDRDINYNDENWGVGYEWEQNGVIVSGQVFNNSLNTLSLALSVGATYDMGDEVSLGVHWVSASGYEDHPTLENSGILSFPLYSVRYQNVRLLSSYPLGRAVNVPDLITLQLIFDIKNDDASLPVEQEREAPAPMLNEQQYIYTPLYPDYYRY